MHELPEVLTNSLRSYRGSVHGNSTRNEVIDLEKGVENYGDKEFDQALSPTESSLVVHPTHSHHALKHKAIQQGARFPSRDPAPHGQQQDHAQHPNQIKRVPRRQGTLPPQTPASAKQSIFSAPKVDDPDPAADRIAERDSEPLSAAEFYDLIGMRPPDTSHQIPKELAIRHGLYGQIQHRLTYIQRKYRIFDVLTYALLVLQLILSAVFIVLGALTHVDSHIAIAVLGAVSAVIAGVLAMMKGNGLPNRLRQTRDALRNVIFETEELYWDVGVDREVYFKDIVKLREDYLRVMEEARRNHPDTWNSTTTGVAKGIDLNRRSTKPVPAKPMLSKV